MFNAFPLNMSSIFHYFTLYDPNVSNVILFKNTCLFKLLHLTIITYVWLYKVNY